MLSFLCITSYLKLSRTELYSFLPVWIWSAFHSWPTVPIKLCLYSNFVFCIMDFVADSFLVFSKLCIDVVGYFKVKAEINKYERHKSPQGFLLTRTHLKFICIDFFEEHLMFSYYFM